MSYESANLQIADLLLHRFQPAVEEYATKCGLSGQVGIKLKAVKESLAELRNTVTAMAVPDDLKASETPRFMLAAMRAEGEKAASFIPVAIKNVGRAASLARMQINAQTRSNPDGPDDCSLTSRIEKTLRHGERISKKSLFRPVSVHDLDRDLEKARMFSERHRVATAHAFSHLPGGGNEASDPCACDEKGAKVASTGPRTSGVVRSVYFSGSLPSGAALLQDAANLALIRFPVNHGQNSLTGLAGEHMLNHEALELRDRLTTMRFALQEYRQCREARRSGHPQNQESKIKLWNSITAVRVMLYPATQSVTGVRRLMQCEPALGFERQAQIEGVLAALHSDIITAQKSVAHPLSMPWRACSYTQAYQRISALDSGFAERARKAAKGYLGVLSSFTSQSKIHEIQGGTKVLQAILSRAARLDSALVNAPEKYQTYAMSKSDIVALTRALLDARQFSQGILKGSHRPGDHVDIDAVVALDRQVKLLLDLLTRPGRMDKVDTWLEVYARSNRPRSMELHGITTSSTSI